MRCYTQVSRTLFIVVILVIAGLTFVNAQEPTPTFIPVERVLKLIFPALDCPDIQPPFTGPTWNEITVGSSTINDLRKYISELSSSYTENRSISLQRTSFSVPGSVAETENIPPVIAACVHPDDERIIAVDVLTSPSPPLLEQFHMSHLVAEYGVPDFVFWGEALSRRVLVWLSEGVAASVSVDGSEQFVPYGTVTTMAYFPYQTLEGYEERWPYTHRAAPRPEYVTLTPELPHVTNPFDFEAMVATITAEPRRTPMPMFTPLATTSQ